MFMILSQAEIGRRSGGDNVLEREGYAVSAGFSLGLVALGMGVTRLYVVNILVLTNLLFFSWVNFCLSNYVQFNWRSRGRCSWFHWHICWTIVPICRRQRTSQCICSSHRFSFLVLILSSWIIWVPNIIAVFTILPNRCGMIWGFGLSWFNFVIAFKILKKNGIKTFEFLWLTLLPDFLYRRDPSWWHYQQMITTVLQVRFVNSIPFFVPQLGSLP